MRNSLQKYGNRISMQFLSPLRYPGGKGKISDYIELLFKVNNLNGGHYIEPYAGGASVAFSLLFNEYASVIHINDMDYSIYCFWDSVLNYTDDLCQLINDTPVTIDEWNRQKNVQRDIVNNSPLSIGFSTFFLNRTNRSGILNAGVIGGKKQDGKWKIDARYNKDKLINRIIRIALYKNRIKIYNKDALDLINTISNIIPDNSLIYFDPPYYNKGQELYINFYEHADHEKVADLISKLVDKNWLISYDNVEQIRILYSGFRQIVFDINYYAGKATTGSEVFIFSDNLWVPDIDSPTNKSLINEYSQCSVFELRRSGRLQKQF